MYYNSLGNLFWKLCQLFDTFAAPFHHSLSFCFTFPHAPHSPSSIRRYHFYLSNTRNGSIFWANIEIYWIGHVSDNMPNAIMPIRIIYPYYSSLGHILSYDWQIGIFQYLPTVSVHIEVVGNQYGAKIKIDVCPSTHRSNSNWWLNTDRVIRDPLLGSRR